MRQRARPASAEDQNVGLKRLHGFSTADTGQHRRAPAAAAALTCACNEPPAESIVTSNGPKPLTRNFHRHWGLSSSKLASSIASIQEACSAATPRTTARIGAADREMHRALPARWRPADDDAHSVALHQGSSKAFDAHGGGSAHGERLVA